MPRTPAPLTVEHTGWQYGPRLWVVKDATGNVIITAKEEGDARAFVALPALIELSKKIESLLGISDFSHDDYETIDAFHAALTQVDGDKERHA
jgi:hypothetical protein